MGINIDLNTLRHGVASLGKLNTESRPVPVKRTSISGDVQGSTPDADDDEETPARPVAAYLGPPLTVADRRFLDNAEDGVLYLEKFMEIAMDLHPAATPREVVLAFRYFDKEGNGRITKREFKNFWNLRNRGEFVMMPADVSLRVERGLAIFKVFSVQGCIGPDEAGPFFQWCQAQGVAHDTDTQENFIKKIDLDEDGRISYSELLDWIQVTGITIPEYVEEAVAGAHASPKSPKRQPRRSKSLELGAEHRLDVDGGEAAVLQRHSHQGDDKPPQLYAARWLPKSKKAIKARHEMESRLAAKRERFLQERDKANHTLKKRHEKMRKDIEDHIKKMSKDRERQRATQSKELKAKMKKAGAKHEEISVEIAKGEVEFTKETNEQAKEYRKRSLVEMDKEQQDAKVSFFKGALETSLTDYKEMFDKEIVYFQEEFELFLKELKEKNEEEHKFVVKSTNKFIDDEVKSKKRKGVYVTDSEKKRVYEDRVGSVEKKHTESVNTLEARRDSEMAALKKEHARFLGAIEKYYQAKIGMLR